MLYMLGMIDTELCSDVYAGLIDSELCGPV